jgi:hypothetical protein
MIITNDARITKSRAATKLHLVEDFFRGNVVINSSMTRDLLKSVQLEEYYLLGCQAVYLGRWSSTFRKSTFF